MIIKTHQLSLLDLRFDGISYLTQDMLLFDIETTGFSSKTAYIYLIGCATVKDGSLYITQFLTSNRKEEQDLLSSFFALCKNYKQCVSFNGDGFDLPFLKDKARKYSLTDPMPCLMSLDLYKQIKPLQTILKLENLKQKTIEVFLGIQREDMYSGGELIEHFFTYERSGSQKEEDMLLLHNYEDLLGIVYLFPMLSYCFAFQGAFTFQNGERTKSKDYHGNITDNLLITAQLKYPVPKPVSHAKGPYYLVLRSDVLKLNVQVKEEKIPVPYADYKNYYYLEKEDMAVLKELATYVEKNDRKPATVSTAYGKFLLTEENIQSPQIFQPYIKQVLDVLIKWK